MLLHVPGILSRKFSALRLARVFALSPLLWVSAQAQTYYWNPNAALVSSGSGEVQKAYNWTANADGSGPGPKSAFDDDFTTTTLGAAWALIDSVKDGHSNSDPAATAGHLTVIGRGSDVWTTANEFNAVYRSDIQGNFDVSVKVSSQTNTDPWAHAGILVFNDFTNAGLGGAFTVVVTPGHGFAVHFDSTGNDGRFDSPIGGVGTASYPCWLRAVKSGNTFAGYYKKNLADAWILIKQASLSQNTAANSQIGLYVTSHNTAQDCRVVFDNFRGGGDLMETGLDLSFAGTAATADAPARLAAPLTAKSLDFSAYSGTFSFLASALTVSGNLTCGSTAAFDPGTGSLLLNGATGTQVLSLKAGVVLPPIAKSGAGTLQIAANGLTTGTLALGGGVLDLNGMTHTLTGFTATGGSVTGLRAADTLIVDGNADFSGLTALPAAGTVQIRAQGDGKNVSLACGAAAFNHLTLWPNPTGASPNRITVSGNLSVKGALTLRDQRVVSAPAGAIAMVDFRAQNPDVSVDGDLLRVENGSAGAGTLSLLMGNGVWTVKGGAVFSLANGGSADASTLNLAGGAGTTQTLNVSGGSLAEVKHAAAGTVLLAADLSAGGLEQSAGAFNFNGKAVTLSGNLQVTGGGPGTLPGLGGSTLAVSGNASFAGSAGSLLKLDPPSAWSINAAGTLTADFAIVGNSTATGSSGIGSASCVNAGGNGNWSLPAFIPPPSITREPSDTTVLAQGKAVFSLSVSGTGALAYAWHKSGDTATLSTDSVYARDPAAFADSGLKFFCVVTAASGKDTSRLALLQVVRPPQILREPKDLSVGPNKRANFSVSASGSGPLVFNWFRKGGATVLSSDSVFALDPAKPEDDGAIFFAVVSNAYGVDSSREAKLAVAACDSLFEVPRDTFTVDEGQPLVISGKAVCSDGYFWTALSGPAPRILDPEAPDLGIVAPRVAADAQIVYRFSAQFGANPVFKDVTVKVKEAIPDPKFAFPAPSKWNGSNPLALHAALTNAAALSAAAYHPPLAYVWTLSEPLADTTQAGDSLTLKNPNASGLLTVGLCLGNGGTPACLNTAVEVNLLTTSLGRWGGLNLGPAEWTDGTLMWKAPGSARVLDWTGRTLWQAQGRAGSVSPLPEAAQRAIKERRARLEVRSR
jgi:hypothetical protein